MVTIYGSEFCFQAEGTATLMCPLEHPLFVQKNATVKENTFADAIQSACEVVWMFMLEQSRAPPATPKKNIMT
jgi:hypothetical protein